MTSIEEIYQAMLADYAARTGMEPEAGCDVAARLYALAAQVYALRVQADWVMRQSFPQTAEGESLERHAQMRGLKRKQATQARGDIRFYLRQIAGVGRLIPAGTVCMTSGLVRFETLVDGVIPAGERFADVPAQAVEAGAVGNVSPGAIGLMAVAPVGVDYCLNPNGFTGGSDWEDDEQLRKRVLDSFRQLANGVNSAYYRQAAMDFDGVAAAAVLARPRGIGTVDVVVATQSGTPDAALLNRLRDYFAHSREIAVDVQVREPNVVDVDVSVEIRPKEGVTMVQAADEVEQALGRWFTGERLGQDVLRAELNSIIYGCNSVENCQLLLPTRDVTVAEDGLARLGEVTVEEMA